MRSALRPDDRVRVPDRDGRQLDALAAELDRLRRPHLDLADAHRDRAVVADRRRVRAAADGDRHLRVAARAASQAAAIRLPLPENSATDPSGFQITISAREPSAETTSTTPSEPTP